MNVNFASWHDRDMRELAAELIGKGAGWRTLMRELAIPMTTAKNWVKSCRAVGSGVFLNMGSSHRSYDYETKLSAARDHVEGGMSKPDVMKKYGIASLSPLNSWVRKYREGGPEALRPKPKGRPPGSASSAKPKTIEQELAEENRRLRAEVAYLKKLRALEAAKRARGRNAR